MVAGRWHSGNDLNAKDGSLVVAHIGGVIQYVGIASGYGHNFVMIGDDGMVYRYAPHAGTSVHVGQHIKQGDVVGTIGKEHLHFEVIPPDSLAYAQITDPKIMSPEFLKKNPNGQFVSTVTKIGQKENLPTLDPMAFFGMKAGEEITQGMEIGKGVTRNIVYHGEVTPRDFSQQFNKPSSVDVQKLAGVMLAEARAGGADAMERVGQVAMNRLDDPNKKFGFSLQEVLTKPDNAPKGMRNQFAKAMDFGRLKPEERHLADQALSLAQGIVDRTLPAKTDALYFATPKAAKNNSDFRAITRVEPYAGADALHVYYGKLDKTSLANRAAPEANVKKYGPEAPTDNFTNYMKFLSTLPEAKTALAKASLINPRIVAEANWAAEAQQPAQVAEIPQQAEPKPVVAAAYVEPVAKSGDPYAGYRGTPDARRGAMPYERDVAPSDVPIPRERPSLVPKSRPSLVPSTFPARLSIVPSAQKAQSETLTRSQMQKEYGWSRGPSDAQIDPKLENTGEGRFVRAVLGGDPREMREAYTSVWNPSRLADIVTKLNDAQVNALRANIYRSHNDIGMAKTAFNQFQTRAGPVKDVQMALPTPRPSNVAGVEPTKSAAPAYIPRFDLGYSTQDKNAIAGPQPYTPPQNPSPYDIVLKTSPLLVSSEPKVAPQVPASVQASQVPEPYWPGKGSLEPISPSSVDEQILQKVLPPQKIRSIVPQRPAEVVPEKRRDPLVQSQIRVQRTAQPQGVSNGAHGGASNPLVSASGGGRPETTPMGHSIAVHPTGDGGVTTSYYSSTGQIITIHTDANGDTNTVHGGA